jgi:Methyltransferase FkbM domain
VRPYGLSDTAGQFDLFVPYYRGFAYPGEASLDEDTARLTLSRERIYFFRPKHLSVMRIVCELRTLDAENLEPYFIKLDVQGAAYKVLCGGLSTLRHQPILMVETAGDLRITALLEELGYSAYEVADGRFVDRH